MLPNIFTIMINFLKVMLRRLDYASLLKILCNLHDMLTTISGTLCLVLQCTTDKMENTDRSSRYTLLLRLQRQI